ncbi:tetratricopeptide repeat 16 isoform X2 [Brachionus plicatilis]|uniref:Cilia- and flagella-associated protein 157 n=1 Tax=Brachionus plicatilis TaxID=10195 RepID=A0A3M7PZ12_BRAPC|nr:tetratricopeptide repeat 16 isoform X2 [Brachionus plicatilis]
MNAKNKKSKNAKEKKKSDPETFLTIDYYKLQMDNLSNQLKNFKAENEELKFKISKYEEIMKASLNDKTDIIEYLGNELQSKVDEINDLKDRFNMLSAKHKHSLENLNAEFNLKEKEFEEKIENLSNENIILNSKLSLVENFIKEKSILNEKLDQYEETIENLKKQNQDYVYEMEKKILIEKTQQRNEMIEKLADLANEFRNAFHQQMNHTTKKIIKENYSLNSDLQKLSSTTNKLLDENKTLKNMNLKNRLERELNEKNMNDLAKKYVTSIKTLQMFAEKDDLDKDFDSIFDEYLKEIRKLRQENLDLKQEITTLQKDLLNEQNKEKKNSDCVVIEPNTTVMEKSRFIKLIKATADLIIKNLQLSDKFSDQDEDILKTTLAQLAEISNRLQSINLN